MSATVPILLLAARCRRCACSSWLSGPVVGPTIMTDQSPANANREMILAGAIENETSVPKVLVPGVMVEVPSA
jgi:hypothetical protein